MAWRSLLLAWQAGLLACLFGAGPAPAQPRFDFTTTPGRLLKSVVPERYQLRLTLDPQAERFSGELDLALQVRQEVRSVVLHATELKATAATLDGRPLQVQADEPTQTWTLTPADGAPVPAGPHRLVVAYGGRVRDNGSGLYRAPHRVNGQAAQMLATQLQAVYARAVFPSFDEPAFRAVFELAVRAPKDYEVLSNTPETAVVDEGATLLHRFAPTPPMPSYLVSVAVGRFEGLAAQAAGVPLRVLAAPGKREQGAFALGVLQQVLPYYSGYFGQPFALPKLDLLAVPSNRQGAMEDWGLISFSESSLLFNPATDGTLAQRGIYSIVAHEVAHQWFGNLVTAASWEEIWLNEAFATWMAEKATDRFNPEWQVPLRRRADIESAMAKDATSATRAIRSGAVSENSVFDVFDGITYAKGGAVLTMLERWLGPEVFQRGLAAYMQERRFSSATAGDLWHHIGQAAGRDVRAVAASWTNQPGFPLVAVSLRCDNGQTLLALRQQRFRALGEAGPALWRIPVTVAHGGQLRTLLLEEPSQTLPLPGCPAEPTLVNPGGDGFYRVAYEPAAHAALVARYASLPPAAQVSLLSDSFALAQAGQLPMAAYLDLLAALPQVTGPARGALISQAGAGLQFLALVLHGTPAEEALARSARALFAPQLAQVGWAPQAGEDSETEALRSSLIRLLVRFDDPAAVQRVAELVDAADAGRTALSPAIRKAVVRAAGRHADAPRFARLLAQLKDASSEDERWMLASAVSRNLDQALARQVLALALRQDLPNNVAPWLSGMVADEPRHAELAYAFVQEHWAQLAQKTGDMFGAKAWLLPGASDSFADSAAARRLLADQARLAGAPGAATASQVAAQIEMRAAVRLREAARLAEPLERLPARLQGR